MLSATGRPARMRMVASLKAPAPQHPEKFPWLAAFLVIQFLQRTFASPDRRGSQRKPIYRIIGGNNYVSAISRNLEAMRHLRLLARRKRNRLFRTKSNRWKRDGKSKMRQSQRPLEKNGQASLFLLQPLGKMARLKIRKTAAWFLCCP